MTEYRTYGVRGPISPKLDDLRDSGTYGSALMSLQAFLCATTGCIVFLSDLTVISSRWATSYRVQLLGTVSNSVSFRPFKVYAIGDIYVSLNDYASYSRFVTCELAFACNHLQQATEQLELHGCAVILL